MLRCCSLCLCPYCGMLQLDTAVAFTLFNIGRCIFRCGFLGSVLGSLASLDRQLLCFCAALLGANEVRLSFVIRGLRVKAVKRQLDIGITRCFLVGQCRCSNGFGSCDVTSSRRCLFVSLFRALGCEIEIGVQIRLCHL